jgi:hypothetical protein
MSQDQAPAVPTQPEVLITASQSLEPQCIENPLGNSNSPRGFTLDKIRHVLLECLSEADHIFPPAHSRQKSTFQDDFCEDQRETTTLGTLSSNLQGREYKAAFAVQWDVKAFMSTQYAKWDASSLRSVITLTGNSLNAQAATCEDYLLQNWPITGKLLLVVLQKAISGGRSTTKGILYVLVCRLEIKSLTNGS